MKWYEAGDISDFEDDDRLVVDFDDISVLVIKLEDSYVAIENMCSHASFELDDAPIDGEQIICPLHGAHFCLRTGKALTPPAYEDISSFPTKIEGSKVYVADNRD